MALFIAKAPQYRASEKVPAQIGGRYADLRPSRAENRAIERFGGLLVLRAEEMKQERDAAVVGDLYNQWRDADRQQLGELLSKKGKDAVNLDQDYDRFYNKSSGEADQQAENGSQQRALKEILNRKRGQNLDILARYESQEGQRYRNEQEIGFVNNAVADARGHGFDDLALENTLVGTFDYVQSAHPGMSAEALETLNRKYRSQILFANMQSRINEDPARALKDIEGWKEALGEGYYTLKDKLKGKVVEQKTEAALIDLEQKFEGDYDKMISYMSRKANYEQYGDLKVSQSIRQELRARNTDKTNRENKAKIDGLNNEMSLWNKARYEENNPVLGKSILDDMVWHDKYAPERKAQMYRANSQTETDKNDDAAESELLETINTDPKKFEYQEYVDFIWSDKFSGVTGTKRQTAQKRLETMLGTNAKSPQRTEKQKVYFDALKTMKKWFGEDEAESIPIYTEKIIDLQNYFDEHPDASDQEVQSYFEDLTKGAVERGTFEWLLDFLGFVGGTTSPGAKAMLEHQQEGYVQTATNPDTGEKMGLTPEGKWVPIK